MEMGEFHESTGQCFVMKHSAAILSHRTQFHFRNFKLNNDKNSKAIWNSRLNLSSKLPSKKPAFSKVRCGQHVLFSVWASISPSISWPLPNFQGLEQMGWRRGGLFLDKPWLGKLALICCIPWQCLKFNFSLVVMFVGGWESTELLGISPLSFPRGKSHSFLVGWWSTFPTSHWV